MFLQDHYPCAGYLPPQHRCACHSPFAAQGGECGVEGFAFLAGT